MDKNKSTVLILTLLLFLNFPFISYSQSKEVELVIYNQELYFGSKEGGGNYQNEVVLILKNNSNKKLAFLLDDSDIQFPYNMGKIDSFFIQAIIRDSVGYILVPEEYEPQFDPTVFNPLDRFKYNELKKESEFILRNPNKDYYLFSERKRLESSILILEPHSHTYISLHLALPEIRQTTVRTFDRLDNSNNLKNVLFPANEYSLQFKLYCNPLIANRLLYKKEMNILKKNNIRFFNGTLETKPIKLTFKRC